MLCGGCVCAGGCLGFLGAVCLGLVIVSPQWSDFTGIFVVFTTFLILLGSGMVRKKVVW